MSSIVKGVNLMVVFLLLTILSTTALAQNNAAASGAAPELKTATSGTLQQNFDKKYSDWSKPATWFVYVVIIVIFAGSLFAILMIRGALSSSTWSLSDALSEEAEITAFETVAGGAKKPMMDATGKPVMVTEMRASTSRVVALMGMVVIILMFIGFGIFSLYGFAMNGCLPDNIDRVVKFLLGGLTLFAPYLVNKFSSIFESLSPKKQ